MKYLHTMVRVNNIDESLDFYCNKLGLKEVRRIENKKGRFTLIFLGAENSDNRHALLELTYNWDPEEYNSGRNFGHFSKKLSFSLHPSPFPNWSIKSLENIPSLTA